MAANDERSASVGMIHNVKIKKRYADAVVSGDKTFEVRENDRDYHVGDIVQFSALSNLDNVAISHPINDKRYEITYLLTGWGIENGWCVFSIREVPE